MAKKKLSAIEKNKLIYDEFVKSLEGKTKDELLAMEQDLIKEIDKHDKKVGKTSFTISNKEALPEAVDTFHYFINKQKLQYNYVGGMLQLWDAFNVDMDSISYPLLDVILMNLGQMSFEGHDEWVKISKFEEFTKPFAEEYATLKAKTYLLSEEHSALISKLGIDNPVASNPGNMQ